MIWVCKEWLHEWHGCLLDGYFLDGCFLDGLLNRCFFFRWLLLRWLLLTSSLCKTHFGETGCLGNPYFLIGCLSIQFFGSPITQSARSPMVTYPHCAAPVWLTGSHAAPLVTRYFPPNHYLGRRRTSLGVKGILSMCLRCSHT